MVNFKVAGRLLKEKIQQFKQTIEGLNDTEMKELVDKYNDDSINKIKVEGYGDLEKDVFIKNMKPKANIVVINDNGYTVALNTTLNEELIIEGMYRDLLRKEAGLKVEQRINLSIIPKGKLMKNVLEKYIDKIMEDTLTENFSLVGMKNSLINKEIEINGEKVNIQINININ